MYKYNKKEKMSLGFYTSQSNIQKLNYTSKAESTVGAGEIAQLVREFASLTEDQVQYAASIWQHTNVNLSPRDLMPSTCFQGHCMSSITDIHVDKTPMHKK